MSHKVEDQLVELILQWPDLLDKLDATREDVDEQKKGYNVKKRNWTFCMYLDSAPEDYLSVIDQWNVPVLLSPIHNMDVLSGRSGELVKPHRHGMICLDGPTPYSSVMEFVRDVGCKIIFPVRSVKSMERYMCHLNNPEKYQYPIEELLTFGGYEPQFLGDEFDGDGIKAIIQFVEENGIIVFADLMTQIFYNLPEYGPCFNRYQSLFNNYCASRERMAKKCDNGSYVKYTDTRRVGMGM